MNEWNEMNVCVPSVPGRRHSSTGSTERPRRHSSSNQSDKGINKYKLNKNIVQGTDQ